MIQVFRILVITLLLNSISFASEKLTIQELISIASTYVKQPVVLDRNIDNTLYIYTQTKLTQENVNNILFEVLKNNGLQLIKTNAYYLLKTIKKEKSITRFIQIKNLSSESIDNIMKYYQQDYLFVGNTLMFKSLHNNYQEILASIEELDKPAAQKILKVTVLETNVNKLKEYGTKYKLSDVSKNLWDVSLGNTVATLSPAATKSYGIEVNALVADGISKIKTHPLMAIRHGKTVSFNVVNSLPRVTGTTTQGEDSKTTTSIDYTKIGLKVSAKSIIYDNKTDLKLNLVIQDLLSNINNMPFTSDKEVNQEPIVTDDEIFILSGFRKTIRTTDNEGIPFLKDIPWIGGFLFGWNIEEDTEISLQIFIEITSLKSESRELTTISPQGEISQRTK